MRDTLARLITEHTITTASGAAISGAAISIPGGTPFEGIPVALRVWGGTATAAGAVPLTVTIYEATASGGTYTANEAWPALTIASGTTFATEITRRVICAKRPGYLKAVAATGPGTMGPTIYMSLDVVTADIT